MNALQFKIKLFIPHSTSVARQLHIKHVDGIARRGLSAVNKLAQHITITQNDVEMHLHPYTRTQTSNSLHIHAARWSTDAIAIKRRVLSVVPGPRSIAGAHSVAAKPTASRDAMR